jgi:hypothetical protein
MLMSFRIKRCTQWHGDPIEVCLPNASNLEQRGAHVRMGGNGIQHRPFINTGPPDEEWNMNIRICNSG